MADHFGLAFIDSHVHPHHSWNDFHNLSTEQTLNPVGDAISRYIHEVSGNPFTHEAAIELAGSLDTPSTVTFPARSRGLVYVCSRSPSQTNAAGGFGASTWEELAQLRDVALSASDSDSTAQRATMLLGLTIWAPLSGTPENLRRFLAQTETVLGEAFPRVKAVSFALDDGWDRVSLCDDSIKFCVREVWRRKWTLQISVGSKIEGLKSIIEKWRQDIGSESRFCNVVFGEWPLHTAQARLNHVNIDNLGKDNMCDPSTFDVTSSEYQRWEQCVRMLGDLSGTFVKITYPESTVANLHETNGSLQAMGETARTLLPCFKVMIEAFGPSRCMFGSGWSVHPGEGASERRFEDWAGDVQRLMALSSLSVREQQMVWAETTSRVFGLTAL